MIYPGVNLKNHKIKHFNPFFPVLQAGCLVKAKFYFEFA